MSKYRYQNLIPIWSVCNSYFMKLQLIIKKTFLVFELRQWQKRKLIRHYGDFRGKKKKSKAIFQDKRRIISEYSNDRGFFQRVVNVGVLILQFCSKLICCLPYYLCIICFVSDNFYFFSSLLEVKISWA